jgi:hypothetical protein
MTDSSHIPDVPKGGPLQAYRDKATFKWKELQLFFDDIELIKYRVSSNNHQIFLIYQK